LNGSYCAQSTVNACIDDVTDYTRDTAIETAENQIRSENDGAFQEGNETMFRLAESPELEWTIGGRSRANRSRPDSNRSQRLNDQFAHNPGYFASLIPANTIQGSPTTAPDRGNYDDESVSVLSRFRLYNLTESEGQVIPEPDEWSDYPDALLTQDWNTIIVPIRRSLDSSGPAGTADRQLPAASGLHQWTKDALLH